MRDKFVKPTFQQFFDECVLPGFPNMPPEAVPPGGLLTMLFFGFVNGWWPLRNKPNVLMLHFNDMKADHEGTIRKIAAFLGFKPTAEQWPRVLEYTSFPWMKVRVRGRGRVRVRVGVTVRVRVRVAAGARVHLLPVDEG